MMMRLVVMVILLMTSLAASAQAELTGEQVEAVKAWLRTSAEERPGIETLGLPEHLSREDAEVVKKQLWEAMKDVDSKKESQLGGLPSSFTEMVKEGKIDLTIQHLTLGEHAMPFVVVRREEKAPPESGRALFLCLHGGGQNPRAKEAHSWMVNTREFQAQIQLSLKTYPSDGIYFVPRMADDRLGRWWHHHNHVAFDQVIDHAVMQWGVDPNRVYLLGISEGGYGTAILAPYMADRFAGASAMAAGVGLGNPAANLRNLAFRTDVGENDSMFDRCKLAIEFHQELDRLHENDPAGYVHSINVQSGKGHGIKYDEGPAWMVEHSRCAFPSKFVWVDQPLHEKRRSRFYWVEWENTEHKGRSRIVGTADRDANRIDLTVEEISSGVNEGNPTHINSIDGEAKGLSDVSLTLLLSDELVDLDREVGVVVNGKPLESIKPNRSAAAMLRSLLERADPAAMAVQDAAIRIE